MQRLRGLLYLLVITLSCRTNFVDAQGFSPEEAVRRMTVADGFVVELAATEPLVRQPVAIDFDDRGRLWVLQYLQYPNPAGLKRVKVDRYSRTVYDRVPEPPPRGPKGADRLTILEDIDGDGRAETAADFLSDLNLATGFAFGYGGVFVLQTPYLLFYPDRDRDDIPDGDPEVLLKGFGMEDTSSLANSLIWGPDGWLYGTQGTNLTADIRGIAFEQGIWRYHPVTKKFELFMEGGSNMWGLDFDRTGQLLAGTNYGGYLIFHAVQGAYYQKSFAKHGELHNPFAFGYFEHVPHENFQGGHVTVGGFVYQGTAFPATYRDKYVAVDTLGHAVRWHHVEPDRSTFRSENGGVLLQANDTWFAPSDAVQGPDGAVFIADWYDQRTAHPDPDATWDRSNGRIYRLRSKTAALDEHVDPNSLPSRQLVEWLTSENEWKVRRARRVLAERADSAIADILRESLRNTDDDHLALQMLWTLAAIGEFDENADSKLLNHPSADIRAWTIRLLGDSRHVTAATAEKLMSIAADDPSVVVLSQLANTAQRLPDKQAIRLARALAGRDDVLDDPHIPLLIWWAVERHATTDVDDVLQQFASPEAWKTPLIRKVILGRLMRRYAGEGSQSGFTACARLLDSAPDDASRRNLLEDLDQGLKLLGRERTPGLPLGSSFADLAIKKPHEKQAARKLETIPPPLAEVLATLWQDNTTDPLIVRVATRLGSEAAYGRAVELARSPSAAEETRLATLSILQELGGAEDCVPLGIQLLDEQQPTAVRLAAVDLLARFSDNRITEYLLDNYGRMDPDFRSRTRDVLLGRAASARAFLREIDRGKYSKDEITPDQLRRVALHADAEIDALVRKHWGTIRAGTPEEKLAEIRRITNDLRAAAGDPGAGKIVFTKNCANCHKLFGEGKEIGPDLTKANRGDREFLLASLVDPNVQIRKEFLSYIVVTNDGRVVTGLLAEETPAAVTLLGAKNERTVIPRDTIDEMKASTVSLMPEGILKPLTPQELRDLFTYLQSGGQ